jgi:hypothetical protein
LYDIPDESFDSDAEEEADAEEDEQKTTGECFFFKLRDF